MMMVRADGAEALPLSFCVVPARSGGAALLKLGGVNGNGAGRRVDTTGGKAPEVGCDKAHAKAEVRVPYEASYYFYSLTPGSK